MRRALLLYAPAALGYLVASVVGAGAVLKANPRLECRVFGHQPNWCRWSSADGLERSTCVTCNAELAREASSTGPWRERVLAA